jgi:His/Glu/Gln/Arg/opine family amino acid ABC transporter permease subunit
MQFDPSIIWSNLPVLVSGIWLTILLVAIALVFAIVLGLLACAGTLLGRGLVYYLSVGYIGFFRGLPETVIIFWLYYCTPLVLNTRLSAFWTGTVALAIPSGAYLAEIFRAGILAVSRGRSMPAVQLDFLLSGSFGK